MITVVPICAHAADRGEETLADVPQPLELGRNIGEGDRLQHRQVGDRRADLGDVGAQHLAALGAGLDQQRRGAAGPGRG